MKTKKDKINSGSQMKKCHILISFILSLIFVPQIFAQDVIDSKGTDFWLTYMPNYHNNLYSGNDKLKYGDSLYIFITADEATSGLIEYTNRDGIHKSKPFVITDPNNIYTFKVSYYDYELFGFNMSGLLDDRNQCEIVCDMSFHVTSVNDIIVYAHNQAVTTSEAFMVMPTNALDRGYYIMSYNSDAERSSESRTPSQFAVVATEDDTEIRITPSSDTRYNRYSYVTKTLNRGEVYLVQADIDVMGSNYDLTGTMVNSSKPIAVFGGHQRATIPVTGGHSNPSRDCLIEQIPPVTTWGRNAFLTPYPQPAFITHLGVDMYRVLAAYDNTSIYLNDVLVSILDAGEAFDGPLLVEGEITATAPILVAQYKKTSQNISADKNDSDPFMMLIPPKEQYMDSYRVINLQAYEYSGNSNYKQVYDRQYITVVIPDSAISSLRLDNAVVSSWQFKSIASSGFSYVNMAVSDGTHKVVADSKFGIYVYGYGYANSYGYIGGQSYIQINYDPPSISHNDSCFSVWGKVYDSTIIKSRLEKVRSPIETRENVAVNIESFTPPVDSVNYDAELIDYRQDGFFQIIASDVDNLTSTLDMDIKGFTVGIDSMELLDKLPEYKRTLKNGREYCFNVTLHNYGKFTQQLADIEFENASYFSIKDADNIMLEPGDKITLEICFYSGEEGIFYDTLKIANECLERSLMYIEMETWDDHSPPEYSIKDDDCMEFREFLITDAKFNDYGLEKIEFVKLENCRIEDLNFTPTQASLTLYFISPYLDAVYEIKATDSSGKAIVLIDTIQGFTISFPDLGDDSRLVDFDQMKIGAMDCYAIKIYNHGLLPFEINEARMSFNTLFSAPQSQLPMVVNPKESKDLKVCFRPQYASEDPFTDTLKFFHNCKELTIDLSGYGEEILSEGETRCRVPIRIDFASVPDDYFLDPQYPNPLFGFGGTIRFGVPTKSSVEINIYDLRGIQVMSVLNHVLEAGVYEQNFDASKLNQGVYYYEMYSGGKKLYGKFSVVK